jgi:hypothetical protein
VGLVHAFHVRGVAINKPQVGLAECLVGVVVFIAFIICFASFSNHDSNADGRAAAVNSQSDDSASHSLEITSVSHALPFYPEGSLGDKVYEVRINGTVANDFDKDDALCNSATFVLIGNSKTYEPQSGECESQQVAINTTSDFKFLFEVKQLGDYRLRYDRIGQKTEFVYQPVSIR